MQNHPSTNITAETGTFGFDLSLEIIPLPDDIPGLIERLSEIRWNRNHLDVVNPSLPESSYDLATEVLVLWEQYFMKLEVQCRRELEKRLATVSSEDRSIFLRELDQRNGDYVPAEQMEMAALREKIQSQNQQMLFDEFRAMLNENQAEAKTVPEEPAVRSTGTVGNMAAVQRVKDHIDANGFSLTEFANKIGCDPRTFLSFRTTGKIRHDYFCKIADELKMTKAELLRPL